MQLTHPVCPRPGQNPIPFGTRMRPELARKFRAIQKKVLDTLTQKGYSVTMDANAWFLLQKEVLVFVRTYDNSPEPVVLVRMRHPNGDATPAELAQLARDVAAADNASPLVQSQVEPDVYQGEFTEFKVEVRGS